MISNLDFLTLIKVMEGVRINDLQYRRLHCTVPRLHPISPRKLQYKQVVQKSVHNANLIEIHITTYV